jgi:urease accessory protein
MLHLSKSKASLNAKKIVAGLSAVVLAGAAYAHPGALADTHVHATHLDGLLAGFMHPLTGLDHLAAMLAVGFWSALTARRSSAVMLAPLAFAAMLLLGAVLGMVGWSVTMVEPVIAASVLVLGLLVLGRTHITASVAVSLVGAFALFHGLAHGAELAAMASSSFALAGMVLATLVLHLVGVVAGRSLRYQNVWKTRALGLGLAGFGAQLLLAVA